MTMWQPDIDDAQRPKYVAIADALARDVESGRLLPGARLPTHRELADRLQVTVGTVSRAYADARQRGLVTGEVGRGTFVRQPARAVDFAMRARAPGETGYVDMSFNTPAMSTVHADLVPAFSALSRADELANVLRYQPNVGMDRHRRAGAAWMGYAGLEADPAEVVVTAGAQHGMLLAFSVIAEPGDRILAESLTYPGMNSLARFLRLQLHGLAMDEHGLLPDALEEACRRLAPKALYMTPTIQNPTATLMHETRRRQVAEIAEAYDLQIVEDEIYAYLVPDPPLPVAAFAPHRTFRIDGLSKSVAPGLRVGYLRAPPESLDALASALMTTTIMSSSFTAEVAATLIEDGTAASIVARRRQEVATRQALARRILGDHVSPQARPESLHLWLVLPEPWRAEEFVNRARERGVLVASPELFAVGRSVAPHAVRLSIGAVEVLSDLERGVTILADLLDSPPGPSLARL